MCDTIRIMKDWKKALIWTIVLGAFFVRIFASVGPDMYGDDTLYAFRSFGWTDDFGPIAERGPLGWLGMTPWWAVLSFHDHPPLVFWLQKIFFTFFGDGAFVARLPFIFAGAISVYVLFKFLYRKRGLLGATIGGLVMALSYIGIWVVTVGLLEGVLMVLILLGFIVSYELIYGSGKDDEKKRINYIYTSFVVLALCLLTKYTSLYIFLPMGGALLMTLWKHHTKKYVRHFVFAIVMFFALLSPLIVYNTKLYALRGHFDIAASNILGIHSSDFGQIDGRVATAGGFTNIGHIVGVYQKFVSWPMLLLILVSFVALVVRVALRRADHLEGWLVVHWFAVIFMVTFSDITERMAPMLLPYVAVTVALQVWILLQWLSRDGRVWKIARIGAIVVVCFCGVVEVSYCFKTLFISSLPEKGFLSSQMKVRAYGFNKMDQFLRKEMSPLPRSRPVRTFEQLNVTAESMQGHSAVIYDNRVNWNAMLWYFWRYHYYYGLPVMPSIFLTGASDGTKFRITDIMWTTEKPAYFVQLLSKDVMNPARLVEPVTENYVKTLTDYLVQNKFQYTEITDDAGNPTLRIFKIDREIPF